MAWLIGQIMLDRTWWSQWLLWIPDPALLPAGLMLWGGLWVRRWPWAWTGLVVAMAGPVLFLLLLWSPGRMAPAGDSITLLHWTAGPIYGDRAPYGDFIVSQDPDIAIVEGARRAATTPAFRAWSRDAHVTLRGPFLISSKLPIQSVRMVAWAKNILLLLLVVELPSGSPLRILVVDLPSDPSVSRSEVLLSSHDFLARLETAPDLVVGDFNLTQRSYQLRAFMPGMSPDWARCGVGWGGTYPRALPTYRLDHVLSGPNSVVRSITTTDPGVGRHRAQLLELQPTQGSPASSQ
jgi:hypothetical protein